MLPFFGGAHVRSSESYACFLSSFVALYARLNTAATCVIRALTFAGESWMIIVFDFPAISPYLMVMMVMVIVMIWMMVVMLMMVMMMLMTGMGW